MDSQFRCSKCSRPISSKYAKCLDCGSLGPHIFTGSPDAAIEAGPAVDRKPGRRDYPAELVDRQPPHATHAPERYEGPAPLDTAEDVAHTHSRPVELDEESRFPAGMKSRSPILDYVEDIDEEDDDVIREKRRRRDRDEEEDEEDRSESVEDEEEEEEEEDEDEDRRRKRTAPEKSNTAAWIVGIVLVLALIIAAIYVINNYEELTRWLASPTIPNVFKPSE